MSKTQSEDKALEEFQNRNHQSDRRNSAPLYFLQCWEHSTMLFFFWKFVYVMTVCTLSKILSKCLVLLLTSSPVLLKIVATNWYFQCSYVFLSLNWVRINTETNHSLCFLGSPILKRWVFNRICNSPYSENQQFHPIALLVMTLMFGSY